MSKQCLCEELADMIEQSIENKSLEDDDVHSEIALPRGICENFQER